MPARSGARGRPSEGARCGSRRSDGCEPASVPAHRRDRPVSGELLILAPIPCVSCSCYNAERRDLVVLLVHVVVTLSRLSGPAGIRSVVAESVLVKQQLLILNRSRERAPSLRASDRFVAGLCALFMPPTRVICSAIVLKPSTLLSFHQALRKRKYRILWATSSAKSVSVPIRHRQVSVRVTLSRTVSTLRS